MNYLNVQKEIIKAAAKQSKVASPWKYAKDEHDIYVTNSVQLWVIPNPLFYLDAEKVFPQQALSKQFIDTMTKNDGDVAKWTGVSKTLIDGTVVNIFDCNGVEIAIDSKRLKDFDLRESNFRGKSYNTPLYIYEDERLVGVICPMKVR